MVYRTDCMHFASIRHCSSMHTQTSMSSKSAVVHRQYVLA